MAIFIKEPNEILGEAYTRLLEKTPVKKLTPGSTARALLEIIADEQGALYSDLSFNVAQSFVSKAVAENLDLIGALVGVARRGALTAIDNTYSNFRFKIDPATGLDGSDIADRVNDWLTRNARSSDYVTATTFTIKSGTRINSDTGVVYATIEDAVFGANDVQVFVPVISLSNGETANVGAGALTGHRILDEQQEFTPVASVLLCENLAPITNGADLEGDEDYRFRIVNSTTGSENANDTAVRLAALSVPGVADVSIRNFSHGVGSFSVFVIGVDPVVSDGTINAVRGVVTEKTAKGIRVEILRPVYRSIEPTISLQFIAGSGEAQRSGVKTDVRRAVANYITGVEMGGALIMNRIIQEIFSVSDIIVDANISHMLVGEYNVDTKALERRSEIFVMNQTLFWDEKFYTTPSLITIC